MSEFVRRWGKVLVVFAVIVVVAVSSRLLPVGAWLEVLNGWLAQAGPVGWLVFFGVYVMHIRDDHFLNLYFNVAYSLASKVHVKGFNAYGGGYGTDGVIDAEDIFFAVFAFEYSLSRRWAFACDAQAIFCGDTAFSGNPGIVPDSDTSIEPMGVPSSNIRRACVQYVLSPAIEYNWSSNVGAIFGTVFTVAGKNSSNFTSAVFSINYYH